MPRARILICDDEEGVRESLKLILSDHYDVTAAEHGEQAVQHLAQAAYDVLILDLKMPRMDGIETLGRVRQIAPQLPVLILTAYQSVDIAKEAIRLGANDYLSKPFERDEVLSCVDRLLSRSRVT